MGSVAVILYLCSLWTWTSGCKLKCEEQSQRSDVCLSCKLSPRLWLSCRACVDWSFSFFFWCSSLKQQLVCEQEGEIKREMGFGSTEAVWIWSREAKQQTHPEFKWIFLKKGITSDYLHHRGEEDALVIGFCSAFVSFISLTVTCFHWFVHPNSLFPDRKREKLSQLSYQTEMQCYTNTARDVPVH